jgi:hypothetical protein
MPIRNALLSDTGWFGPDIKDQPGKQNIWYDAAQRQPGHQQELDIQKYQPKEKSPDVL